jgi:ABC-2 type transport system ATP-binding protein
VTSGPAAALEVTDLVREYVVREKAEGRFRRQRRVVRAVDGLSLRVEPGESVGFIGANGAGKSTTVKLLTGVLVPSAGSVRTCGLDPVARRRDLARRIGVVFGQRSQLWWDLPLSESFRLLAAIHHLPAGVWRPRLRDLDDRLGLGEFLTTPVRQLSLGQRMRGEVAAALLHSPELLLLDEPTIGLDVLSSERLRQFLRAERAERGTTLLLTTHDMGDVQRLCDRVLVVDRGRAAYDGDLPGLVRRVGARRVLVVDLTAPTGPIQVEGAQLLGVEAGGLRQRFAFSAEETTAAAVLAGVSAHAEVRDLSVEEPDIADVLRQLYASSGTPQAGVPPESARS